MLLCRFLLATKNKITVKIRCSVVEKQMDRESYVTKRARASPQGGFSIQKNDGRFQIVLFEFKFALLTSFLSPKIERVFYLERGK